MKSNNPTELAEVLKATWGRKHLPQPVQPLAGRFQHFATEADRQRHAAHVEQHKHLTPF